MAKELERAQDNAVTLARAALAKVAERIQRLDAEEMQVGQIPAALKTLIELEFKALGYEDAARVRGEGGGQDRGGLVGGRGLGRGLRAAAAGAKRG